MRLVRRRLFISLAVISGICIAGTVFVRPLFHSYLEKMPVTVAMSKIIDSGLGAQMVAHTLERKLRYDCSSDWYKRPCPARMRATGDLWQSVGRPDRAERWYRSAANVGDTVAMFNMGWLLEKKAEENFMISVAALRDQQQEVDMPSLKESGSAERELAAEWYRKAADAGFAPAMNNLALLYYNASGVHEDRKRAEDLLRRSSEAGSIAGSLNLAILFPKSANGNIVAEPEFVRLVWDPRVGKKAYIANPTLERTFLLGGEPMDASQIATIRQSAKDAIPVTLTLTPMRPDPTLPVFKAVQKVIH